MPIEADESVADTCERVLDAVGRDTDALPAEIDSKDTGQRLNCEELGSQYRSMIRRSKRACNRLDIHFAALVSS